MDELHAVFVDACLRTVVWLEDQFVVAEWRVIDVVMPTIETPHDASYVWVQVRQHLAFRLGAFFCIKLFGVAALHPLGCDFAAQERIELHSAVAVFQHAQ